MSEDCPHCVFEKTESNCRGCFEGSHYKPKPVTNADRIRSMTDEELAMWIRDQIIDRNIGIPSETWLAWLQQPATE